MAQRWVLRWDPAKPIFWQGLSNTNFLVNTTAPNLNPTAVTLTTASQIHIVNCIHLRIHHTSRIPYLQFHSFLDLVIYEVTTLIFLKNQRQCASFSINVAILSLSIKRATTVPNKSIDSQHYRRLRRKILITFHSLSHFTLTTMQLNLSFLKTLNYPETIQRLALSFRNL